MKTYYTMGALHRGGFRSMLLRLEFQHQNFEFTEDRRFLHSVFYVKTDSAEVLGGLSRVVEEYKKGA